jgi:hypothetical protein
MAMSASRFDRKLTDYHLKLYAAPGYLARSPPITARRDLERHRFLALRQAEQPGGGDELDVELGMALDEAAEPRRQEARLPPQALRRAGLPRPLAADHRPPRPRAPPLHRLHRGSTASPSPATAAWSWALRLALRSRAPVPGATCCR